MDDKQNLSIGDAIGTADRTRHHSEQEPALRLRVHFSTYVLERAEEAGFCGQQTPNLKRLHEKVFARFPD